MTADNHPATTTPSRHQLQAKRASRAHRVTGALKVACDFMIYGDDDGNPLEWDAAAKRAGLRTRSMRLALDKPWVRAYLRQQRDIVAASLAATNLVHIASLRSSSNQMTRLGAARLIEDIAGTVDPGGATRRVGPGVTIIIGSPPPDSRRPMIDVTPIPADDPDTSEQ